MRLVKEDCCTDKRNVYWTCSNKFFELAFIAMEQNVFLKQILQKKPSSCFRNFIDLSCKSETYVLCMIYIVFLSVCPICKFCTSQIFFISCSKFCFIFALVDFHMRKIILPRPENTFTEIMLCSKYSEENIRKYFCSYWLKSQRQGFEKLSSNSFW